MICEGPSGCGQHVGVRSLVDERPTRGPRLAGQLSRGELACPGASSRRWRVCVRRRLGRLLLVRTPQAAWAAAGARAPAPAEATPPPNHTWEEVRLAEEGASAAEGG